MPSGEPKRVVVRERVDRPSLARRAAPAVVSSAAAFVAGLAVRKREDRNGRSPAPVDGSRHSTVADEGRHTLVRDLAARMRRAWVEDRINGVAAEVAFYAVLSVFPALLALASAAALLDSVVSSDVATRVERAILDALDTVLTDQASGALDAVERLFEEGRNDVFTLAVLGGLWSASRGAAAAIRVLGIIYDVAEARPWWHRRLLALGVAVGSVLVLALTVAALVLGPLLGSGHAVARSLGLGDVFAVAWQSLRLPVAFVVLVGWAALLYHLAPDRHRGWRWDLPGAVLAAVSWLGLSSALRLYLVVAGAANEVLGILGGVLIVLIWLYLLSLGLLLGGELNAVLLERRFGRANVDAGRHPQPPRDG